VRNTRGEAFREKNGADEGGRKEVIYKETTQNEIPDREKERVHATRNCRQFILGLRDECVKDPAATTTTTLIQLTRSSVISAGGDKKTMQQNKKRGGRPRKT
jgi:hypothetical protein